MTTIDTRLADAKLRVTEYLEADGTSTLRLAPLRAFEAHLSRAQVLELQDLLARHLAGTSPAHEAGPRIPAERVHQLLAKQREASKQAHRDLVKLRSMTHEGWTDEDVDAAIDAAAVDVTSGLLPLRAVNAVGSCVRCGGWVGAPMSRRADREGTRCTYGNEGGCSGVARPERGVLPGDHWPGGCECGHPHSLDSCIRLSCHPMKILAESGLKGG